MDKTDEGLLFEGMLPVSFQRVDNFPDLDQFAFINEENENLLRTSLIWYESAEVDEHDEISLELRRQDLKITLLLDMVGELLRQQIKFLPPIMLKLTARGLECTTSPAINEPGEKVKIALYITPSTPRALKLYGEVREMDADDRVTIGFVGVSQVVHDCMEKIIFRHHRRAIAQGLASK